VGVVRTFHRATIVSPGETTGRVQYTPSLGETTT
jgi:hypothetical protein